tara:strand:+ start:176 stop:349 length:174 start_codon:yes stop_codon:yes gene_type:complete
LISSTLLRESSHSIGNGGGLGKGGDDGNGVSGGPFGGGGGKGGNGDAIKSSHLLPQS